MVRYSAVMCRVTSGDLCISLLCNNILLDTTCLSCFLCLVSLITDRIVPNKRYFLPKWNYSHQCKKGNLPVIEGSMDSSIDTPTLL